MITPEEQPENFKNFLLINNIYNSYKNHLMNQHGITFEALVMGRKKFYDLINSSLVWDDCNEGHDFWYKLSETWNAACNKGIKFTPRCKSIW